MTATCRSTGSPELATLSGFWMSAWVFKICASASLIRLACGTQQDTLSAALFVPTAHVDASTRDVAMLFHDGLGLPAQQTKLWS